MKFNRHSQLEGMHAFLSASKYSWLNYTDNKLDETYRNHSAKQRGTRLHEFASEAINMKIKMPRNKQTLNAFINDAIGHKMDSEVVLFYSINCFGTADAISFRDGKLRIFDLKTGVTPVNVAQLEIYAALFCLEYLYNPNDIDIELRVYQNNEILYHYPEAQTIMYIMEKIKLFDMRIEKLKSEE